MDAIAGEVRHAHSSVSSHTLSTAMRARLWMDLMLALNKIALVVSHSILAGLAMTAAILLRYDFVLPGPHNSRIWQTLLLAVLVKTVVFRYVGLYRTWWRAVGIYDLLHLFLANLVATALLTAASLLLTRPMLPPSIYVNDFLVCFLATAGVLFSVRIFREAPVNGVLGPPRKHVLIYGAGCAGITLLKELRSNPSLRYKVLGFLDDDRRKVGSLIVGVPVLGTGRDAACLVESARTRGKGIDEIVIAMPAATGRQMREATANCRAAGVTCRTIPGTRDLLEGKVLSAQMREISVSDLLGREAVQLDKDIIRQAIQGRNIMVTGGAGSIGSEICRQVSLFNPSKIVIFDQAESELFKIDWELRTHFPAVPVVPVIGDIREPRAVKAAIRRHSVSSIFHAAAYKHVPLMEINIKEAIINNVLGTWNVARAAAECRAEKFLMISSDKAINPSSIMGATKRAAELIVSSMTQNGFSLRTEFVSVRFGNVLGSNGSVVPIFQQQIAAGGPVTVTHPDMRRYFMTIPEAVQLVLQASTMGKGSEIFLLNMGEPVRIIDLARNMIRLAGFVPDDEIEIRIVGPRPGEKLCEELVLHGEDILPTYHDQIKIFRNNKSTRSAIESWISRLAPILVTDDDAALVEHLRELVPEYKTDPRRHGPQRERYVAVAAATVA